MPFAFSLLSMHYENNNAYDLMINLFKRDVQVKKGQTPYTAL